MNDSLSNLAKILKEKPTLSEVFGRDKAKDLSRKGIFPYEWFDSLDKLEQIEFPDYECFRSKLKGLDSASDAKGVERSEQDGDDELRGVNIDRKDYDHGVEMYSKFCKNFKDFHDLYMQTDVLLLCDVFEEFGDMCFEYFKFDPKNYYIAPGFAWDALLLFSNARLEPLVEEDMYIFIKRGIRGGYSNVHKRYSKANYKYLDDFNAEMISKFLIYWDFNSMYATAVLKAMPYQDFTVIFKVLF